MVNPIRPRKVYELLAERLAVDIGAALAPGDTVPSERALTEQYGVGRSSVREALRMLESRGAIQSRRGAFVVAAPGRALDNALESLLGETGSDLRHLFEVRAILEAEAAALAARRRTADDLAALQAAIGRMESVLDDEHGYVAADIDFHLCVARATLNPVVTFLMEAIRGRLRNAFGSVFQIDGSARRSIEEHRSIAAAIQIRDPDGARQKMLEHIRRVEDEFQHIQTHPAARGLVRPATEL